MRRKKVNLVDVAVIAGLLLLAMWAMFTGVDSDVFDLEYNYHVCRKSRASCKECLVFLFYDTFAAAEDHMGHVAIQRPDLGRYVVLLLDSL